MRKTLIVIALLLLQNASFAEDTASGQGVLDVNITNIENASGVIYLSLQNSAQGWLSTDPEAEKFRELTQEINSTDDITISIEGLPKGNYAVSLFHDLNDNQDLDTNFIGFPKEPFAFSGPMGLTGPPKFEDAKIEVTGEKSSLDIKLN